MEDPAGGISFAKYNAAQTLAACSQWIVDTDSADATEALTHIYYDALPPSDDGDTFKKEELIELRPFCIVATNAEQGYSWGRIGAEAWDDHGSIVLIFQYNVPDSMVNDEQQLFRWFENRLGNIMRPDPSVFTNYVGFTTLAHSAGYFAGVKVDLGIIGRIDQKAAETKGDYVLATIQVDWGVKS